MVNRIRRVAPRGAARLSLVGALLMAVVVLHTVGLFHAAIDVYSAVADHAEHHDTDCEEKNCPPSCPACHCPHRGVMPPSYSASEELFAILSFAEVSSPPIEALQHDDPVLGSVYRPPRSDAA